MIKLAARSPGRVSVGSIEGGISIDVGPGDMAIVPAQSPHGFSEITETISYLVVRVGSGAASCS